MSTTHRGLTFRRNCHEELYNEFRQFQHFMNGVPEDIRELRTEQRLMVNALSLMSERLNLLHRMMAEMYERIVKRS